MFIFTLILKKTLGILLLCDFITGIIHWLEDSFWTSETPVIGKWIIGPNWEHHKSAQAFLAEILVGKFMGFSLN